MSGTALWTAVLAASLGCYLLKLAGLSVPAAWVEQPWVARTVDFVPAALLAALVAVQAFTSGQNLVVDGRLAGLSVPAAWVEQPWVARVVDFVPAALLAALVAVQAVTTGNDLVLDGRLAGLAVAAVALALRAPFIVVLVVAGAAGSFAHALTG